MTNGIHHFDQIGLPLIGARPFLEPMLTFHKLPNKLESNFVVGLQILIKQKLT